MEDQKNTILFEAQKRVAARKRENRDKSKRLEDLDLPPDAVHAMGGVVAAILKSHKEGKLEVPAFGNIEDPERKKPLVLDPKQMLQALEGFHVGEKGETFWNEQESYEAS